MQNYINNLNQRKNQVNNIYFIKYSINKYFTKNV